jgi:predicted HTH domain antitoxin
LTGEVTIVSKTLDIRIDVPKDVSDKAARFAEAKAREAAVIALQQEGELTIREAAEELGLSYEGYLNLLASRELPISKEASDQTAIDELRQAVLGQGHEEG